ncbi:MAG: prefoldin subunit beta [Thermoplasmata archaeon]|nr:prefoldin subunit beta [Thermoplasmata archaeon]
MNGISPQLQNQIAQYQQVQQQLQAVSSQKVQFDAQRREMARTLEELNAATGDVYKSAGSLLIKVEDKEALKADLEESIETMDVRVSSLDRQEKSLQEKFKVLSDTINAAMGNATARPVDDEE